MAITYQSGSVYTDTTGALTATRSKVSCIIFTTSSAGDSFTLRDGTSGSDPIKIIVKHNTATNTYVIDLSSNPLVFNEGIYLSALSASCHLTIVVTSQGASN